MARSKMLCFLVISISKVKVHSSLLKKYISDFKDEKRQHSSKLTKYISLIVVVSFNMTAV